MERERRRLEAAGETAAAQDSNAAANADMTQEEEKKEEDDQQENAGEDQDMQDEGDDGEGWGEDDDGDGEGWDEWEEDEDEVDPVVAEALAQAARKRELQEKIADVTIKFKPPGYRQGMVARIMGDFTDWVPFTMQMHPMNVILKDPAKEDEFYVDIKLAKGFRYRYLFEVDGVEQLDTTDPNRGTNHKGKMTNYVEVAGGESMTMGDFMAQMAEMQEAGPGADDGPILSKQVSF